MTNGDDSTEETTDDVYIIFDESDLLIICLSIKISIEGDGIEEITYKVFKIIYESDLIIYLSIKLSIEGDTTVESSDEVDTTADKSDVNESEGVNDKTEV